ncbi:hypothetical protein JNB11_06720 [Kocuria palustris]|nr:hypothetical protein [Kocuria palustris]
MKTLSIVTAWLATAVVGQWYPVDRKGEIPRLVPFSTGEEIPLDCIDRNIDTGEHKFDDKNRIMYAPFPMCKETERPLLLKYGVSEDIECTIYFSDTLYHLFQLYIHEDAPFLCRFPYSNEKAYIEAGGAQVPITFNFRGQVTDSKVEIDPNMNVLLTGNNGGIVLAVAWGSGTNTTRVVIGDELKLKFAVRWAQVPIEGLNGALTPVKDGWYKLPTKFISETQYFALILAAVVVSAALTLIFSYKRVLSKVKTASWADEEITKND